MEGFLEIIKDSSKERRCPNLGSLTKASEEFEVPLPNANSNGVNRKPSRDDLFKCHLRSCIHALTGRKGRIVPTPALGAPEPIGLFAEY